VSSLDILAGRLPDGAVSTDQQTLRHSAIDSWSLALLRRVRGDDLPEPVAVVFPARTGEVATVLAWASQTGTAVIPRGAGSGVCGGAQAETQAMTGWSRNWPSSG
jgi:FAD/FMN-containing dehydrogenase